VNRHDEGSGARDKGRRRGVGVVGVEEVVIPPPRAQFPYGAEVREAASVALYEVHVRVDARGPQRLELLVNEGPEGGVFLAGVHIGYDEKAHLLTIW